MLLSDVVDLVCPACHADLALTECGPRSGNEIIDARLSCTRCASLYPVERGIPRFVDNVPGYNASWNYKWTRIDRGRGLNHLILDKSDPAYALHDIYDRNSHGGRAFDHMRGRRAIEIGCGVGQYIVKSLQEHAPDRIVAFDLTEGVDTLRRIIVERYPHYLERILFVQGSVFSMPFRPASFDYVYSLGVLHHTGDTRAAIRAAAGLMKEGGELNFWVYAAPAYHVDTREPGRAPLSAWAPLLRIAFVRLQARAWYTVFSRMSPDWADRVLRPFASGWWHSLSGVPIAKWFTRLVMSPPRHPNRDYRHLNLFDGYVNTWAENWTEAELFPVLRDCSVAVKGISDWRVGFWGVKDSSFYDATRGRGG
ncbi:MAG TPA: methyltransferase domain-containing protein [Vicinamibacterales bacterium]|nr:methyltransferase domain-containing protein [Vicinamibacterales bacterium]